MPAMVLPRLKVIADENRIEAKRFREAREVQELARAELLCRCFVAKLEHGSSPLPDRSNGRYCPRGVPSMPPIATAHQPRLQ